MKGGDNIKGRLIKNIIDKPGETGNSLELYKITENGKNKYFSSEEGYLDWLNKKQLRSECIQYMFDIMGYETNMIMPGRFFKELESWGSAYGFDVVKLCMEDSISENEWVLNKEFDSEVGKVNYLCAIFRNHLPDAMKKWKRLQKQNEENDKFNEDISDIDLDVIGNNKIEVNRSEELLGDIDGY